VASAAACASLTGVRSGRGLSCCWRAGFSENAFEQQFGYVANLDAASAFSGVALSIVLQNGQPTASTLFSFRGASRFSTSRKRLAGTFSGPGSSSFQNCAPPAPQQKEFSRCAAARRSHCSRHAAGCAAHRRLRCDGRDSRDRDSDARVGGRGLELAFIHQRASSSVWCTTLKSPPNCRYSLPIAFMQCGKWLR